jgi:hypothetical protein
MGNIEDYNHVFLRVHRYNWVASIDNIGYVFVRQDHIISSMISISTMPTEHMNQNRPVFDMTDIACVFGIHVHPTIYSMVNVADIEHLDDTFVHIDLCMNSTMTKQEKHIDLKFM